MTSRNSRSKETTISASSHTSDPLLAPFIAPSFDPTAYLNNILPPLGIATAQQPIIPSKSTALPDLVSKTTTQLAQLSAQETRLVDTLTTLTDEILRSGSRLAYEVELLRGEALSLEELMNAGSSLEDDVRQFVPEGQIKTETNGATEADAAAAESEGNDHVKRSVADASVEAVTNTTSQFNLASPDPADPNAPPALARLRTLQHVRNSLQAVISTFDAALSFPLPPSLLSQTNSATSFVSVAAPADPAQEAAGQEALTHLRASIFDKLDPGKGGSAGAEGLAAAEQRLVELRELCAVWKGTSEEKARAKVVDGWEKELADVRQRMGVKNGAAPVARSAGGAEEVAKVSPGSTRDGSRNRGLFGGLRRLGDKIYLE